MTVDLKRGSYVDPNAGRETVAAYARRWAAGRPWRDSSRESREGIVELRIVPTFGAMKLQAVRTSDVQAWVGRMSSEGLAAASVELYYRVMASVMLSARKDRLIQ